MITYKGRQILETLEEIVDPKHTALLVHEMLNDFVTPGGIGTENTGAVIDVSEILPPMVKLIGEARKKNVRLVYVRFTKYNDHRTWNDPMIQKSHKKMMDPNTRVSTVEGTWGHDFRDEIKPQEGDIIVNKFRTDSFFQTNLDLILRSNGIKTFIIIGIGAEAGIVPTVTHGSNIGFFTVVPSDCIRGTDTKWFDDALMMLKDWSTMPTSSEIIKAWNV